jgi:hypothetical protein
VRLGVGDGIGPCPVADFRIIVINPSDSATRVSLWSCVFRYRIANTSIHPIIFIIGARGIVLG